MSTNPVYRMTVYASKETGTLGESTIPTIPYTQFSSWTTTRTTLTDNTVTGPDDIIVNGSTLRETATSGTHLISKTLSSVPNTDITVSIWVKAVNRDYGRLYLTNTGVGDYGIDFDLSGTGSSTAIGAIKNSTIDRIPNGWFFITLTVNLPSIPTSLVLNLNIKSTSATTSYAGNTSNGFNLHGVYLTNATPLAPSTNSPSGSVHTDDFQIASAVNVSGYQPYMGYPRGGGATVSLPKVGTSIGEYSVDLYDFRPSGSAGNAERWVTQFMGDDSGRNRLLGRKASLEESLDAGASWRPFFNGRIHSVDLSSNLKYTVRIRDSIQSLKQDIFLQKPDASSVTYQLNESLLPLGFVESVEGLPQVRPLRGKVQFIDTFGLNGGSLTPNVPNSILSIDNADWSRSDNVITEGFRNAVSGVVKIRGALFFDERTNCIATVRNVTRGTVGTYQVLTYSSQQVDGTERVSGFQIGVIPTPLVVTLDGTSPSGASGFTGWATDDVIEIYCVSAGAIGPDNRLWLNRVHPVQVWKDVLDGKFNPSGSALKIPYDDTAFSSLQADNSIPLATYKIDKRMDMVEFIEKHICQPYGMAYGIHFNGTDAVIHPFSITFPTASLLPDVTIGADDLIASSTVRWNAGTPLQSITYTSYEDQIRGIIVSDPSSSLTFGNTSRGDGADFIKSIAISDKTLNPADYEIGAKGLEIDAIGNRYFLGITGSYDGSPLGIKSVAASQVNKYYNRFMNGCPTLTLECINNDKIRGLKVGQWVLAEVDRMPNTTLKQRGGVRLMQVTGIDSRGASRTITLLDGALNTAMTPPTINSVTSHPSGSGNALNVSITTSENADTEVQFAALPVGAAIPSSVSSQWLTSGIFPINTTTRDIAIPVPLSKSVWVRARNHSPYGSDVKLPSQWVYSVSAVNSSTLLAPSSLTFSNITLGSATANWITGSATANVEVFIASPSGSTLSSLAKLPPGSQNYGLVGLDNYVSSSFTVGVRHFDGIDVSNMVTGSFSTSGSLNTLPSMSYMFVYIG